MQKNVNMKLLESEEKEKLLEKHEKRLGEHDQNFLAYEARFADIESKIAAGGNSTSDSCKDVNTFTESKDCETLPQIKSVKFEDQSVEDDECSETTYNLSRQFRTSKRESHHFINLLRRSLEEEPEHYFFPPDIYSYFACVKYFKRSTCLPTKTFILALFVLVIQVSTLWIFLSDVVDWGNKQDPIRVPAGVKPGVSLSQLIALLISCFNQDEIRVSFNVLQLGYSGDKVRKISRGANCFKWYFSAIVRMLLGMFNLVVTFILVVNSSTVRDVMLDFAAVTFVSELDNGAFTLSKWGYMGREVKYYTLMIETTPVHERGSNKNTLKIPRLLSLFVLIVTMFGFWSYLTIKQVNGHYVDETIFVQFGDEFSPAMSAFSGLYDLKTTDTTTRTYKSREVENLLSRRAKLFYCREDEAWVLQYGEEPVIHPQKKKERNCWSRARSSTTLSYDITRVSSSRWYVYDEATLLEKPLQYFLVQGESEFNGKSCSQNTTCGNNLYCDENTNTCICKDGWFGLTCEFSVPCNNLEVDTGNENGFFGARTWSRSYKSLQENGRQTPIQVYGKPVYVGGESIDETLDVMLFTGRRWILTDSAHIDDYESSSEIDARSLAEFLAKNFHAYWSNYTFYFASEPVDVGTPTESAAPVDLEWYRMEAISGVSLRSGARLWQTQERIEAKLFCAVCNNITNPCFYGGTCNSDGTCDCPGSSSGLLCQIAPVGNGFCDVHFNTPKFSFDGGDCCQETCISTEEHICGKGMIENAAGLSAYGFIGFPNCLDRKYGSKVSGSATLFKIIERGFVTCGTRRRPGFFEVTDGIYSGFDADFCRAIAAAALGDPEAIVIIETSASTRFNDLSIGKFDVLFATTTYTAERDIYQSDVGQGFSFVPPFLFDGLQYGGIPPFSDCADRLDVTSTECLNLTICVEASTTWLQVTRELFSDSKIVEVESQQAEVDGLEEGICNIIAGEKNLVSEFSVRERGFAGPSYELGTNVYSKEPLSALTRQDDRVWSKFVSWIIEALIQAEESGITRLNADKLSTSDVFGQQFRQMFQNAVAANGNYGEIYTKNLERRFPRSGLNKINTGTSGLIYSFPFGAFQSRGPDPITGGTIEAIRRRGVLNCGIQPSPGFAVFDSESGTWTGFEVDICRGIAAALLSGFPNVNFVPLASIERFRALSEGAIDVMGCATTHTFAREVNEPTTGDGFDFTPTIFYDGMGFGGRPPFEQCFENISFDNFERNSNCIETMICVPDGTTLLEAMRTELNIPEEHIFVTTTHQGAYEMLIAGECNVIAGESTHIAESAVRESGYPASEGYFVTKRKFTREPLAFVSRSDDTQFSDFLRWIIFGFFSAAEDGVTATEYVDMPSNNFLFGDSLSRMWQLAIQAAGNYEEMFKRNFAGLLEMEGQNMLNNKNGPQFFATPGVTTNH